MSDKPRIQSHRDLEVWQVGIEITDMVYELSADWPKHELYGLTSQARRAAVSIPSNVAEGHGRRTTRDFLRFLDSSYGSLCEVDTQLHIAKRRDYISGADASQALQLLRREAMMLNALISSLERKIESRR